MSKSLARVEAALRAAGLDAQIREMGDTRTAADAASATRRTPRECTSASAYLAHVAIAMAHTLRAMRPDDLWRSPRYGKPGLAI